MRMDDVNRTYRALLRRWWFLTFSRSAWCIGIPRSHERLSVFRLIIIVEASRVPTMVIRLSRRRTFVAHRRFCLLAAISGVQCASMEADWSWYSPARRTRKSSTLTIFILAILHCFSTENRLHDLPAYHIPMGCRLCQNPTFHEDIC